MQKDTRILQKVMELKRRLEDNWQPELEKLNIWEHVEELYRYIDHTRMANTIFTFIVLCYDASSEYLDTNKDRIDNKRTVLIKLAGPSCFTKEKYVEALLGDSQGDVKGVIDTTIEWYIDNQKDWRWQNIISGIEFHARAAALAKGAGNIRDMKDAGAMLQVAELRREKADQYLEAIRAEWVDLDTVLEKEGKIKISDRLKNDPTNWEMFVLKKNNDAKKLLDLIADPSPSGNGDDDETEDDDEYREFEPRQF